MIGTADGLERCEAIAAVPGLDGLFIGPGDLGLSWALGSVRTARSPSWTLPSTACWRPAARRATCRRCTSATAGYAARMAGEGFDLVTVWVDAAAIGTSLTAAAETWARSAAAAAP